MKVGRQLNPPETASIGHPLESLELLSYPPAPSKPLATQEHGKAHSRNSQYALHQAVRDFRTNH